MSADDELLQLVGFDSKESLIKYGKTIELDLSKFNSVNEMLIKICGKNWKPELIEETAREYTIKSKELVLNFSCFNIQKINYDENFYINENGIFKEDNVKIERNKLIFDLKVIGLDGGLLKEIKNYANWLNITNNYFHIRKIDNIGIYYLIYRSIKISNTLTKLPTKRVQEISETDRAIENISNNLKQMVHEERVMDMKNANANRYYINEKIVNKLPSLSDEIKIVNK